MQPHIVAHLFSAVNKQLSRRENEPNWPDLTEWKVALYTWALSWKAPSSLIFLVWFLFFPVTLYSLKLSLRSGNTLTELQSGSQAKGQNLLSKMCTNLEFTHNLYVSFKTEPNTKQLFSGFTAVCWMFSETHDMNRAFRVNERTAETRHTPKRVSLSIATRECEHFDTILQR